MLRSQSPGVGVSPLVFLLLSPLGCRVKETSRPVPSTSGAEIAGAEIAGAVEAESYEQQFSGDLRECQRALVVSSTNWAREHYFSVDTLLNDGRIISSIRYREEEMLRVEAVFPGPDGTKSTLRVNALVNTTLEDLDAVEEYWAQQEKLRERTRKELEQTRTLSTSAREERRIKHTLESLDGELSDKDKHNPLYKEARYLAALLWRRVTSSLGKCISREGVDLKLIGSFREAEYRGSQGMEMHLRYIAKELGKDHLHRRPSDTPATPVSPSDSTDRRPFWPGARVDAGPDLVWHQTKMGLRTKQTEWERRKKAKNEQERRSKAREAEGASRRSPTKTRDGQ